MKKSMRNNRGMTLLEVSISLTIFGVLLGVGLQLYNTAEQQRRITTTHEHMDAIVDALSVYAQSAGRIPCPADPSMSDITFGWESGVSQTDPITGANDLSVTANKFPVGTCAISGNHNVGIVPFMSLNLSNDTARDGWGHYFTYAVSLQFARLNDQTHDTAGQPLTPATPDTGTIHGRCRTQGWTAASGTPHNISTVKARFCCDDQSSLAINYNQHSYVPTQDLVIKFTDQATVLSPQRDGVLPAAFQQPANSVSFANKNYDLLTNTVLATINTKNIPATDPTKILTPAFVLVSHGRNGSGAFVANGAADQYALPAVNTPEWQNATGTNNVFIDGPQNLTTGANYFDDIVRWMTQDSLMAAHGAVSCSYP